MKILFNFLTLCFLVSCNKHSENKIQTGNNAQVIKENKNIEGVYHYIYPDNTEDLNEDHFIVLYNNGNNLKGRYYSTSDEFDENREGYLPGFFVTELKNIQYNRNTINFSISVDTSEIFSKQVPLSIKSSKDARGNGFKSYQHIRAFTNLSRLEKNYSGKVLGDTIYFKGEIPVFDRNFVKRK
jgi:hypothetical protein